MSGDERQLITAGKESKKDQRIRRIPERLHKDLPHGFLKLRFAGHGRRTHQRERQNQRQDHPRENEERRLPRDERQQPFGDRCTEDLSGAARCRGNGE